MHSGRCLCGAVTWDIEGPLEFEGVKERERAIELDLRRGRAGYREVDGAQLLGPGGVIVLRRAERQRDTREDDERKHRHARKSTPNRGHRRGNGP